MIPEFQNTMCLFVVNPRDSPVDAVRPNLSEGNFPAFRAPVDGAHAEFEVDGAHKIDNDVRTLGFLRGNAPQHTDTDWRAGILN